MGIAWEQGLDGLYFANSSDEGKTFVVPGKISDNQGREACVAINHTGYIAVAWTDGREGWGNDDIYLSTSSDGGATFGISQRVNNDTGTKNQRTPSIAMDQAGHIDVVWMDERSGVDYDVYFATSPPWLPDLAVSSADISFTPLGPVSYGSVVTINATIHNMGKENATDIVVRFYDSIVSPSSLIGEALIPQIEKSNHSWVEVNWTATAPQFHDIWVVVDPENNIPESNESNNTASKQLEVILPPIPAQPGNLTARLTGGESSNVTLGWSLSPDDGGSVNVTRYDIYGKGSFDAGGREYVVMGSVPNATSSYVDEGAGEGDPSNHFYYVCAIGGMNISSCTDNQAAKFTRPLALGPTLVSIPLIQSDESIETVLQTVQYDKAWYYDSSSGEWKWYMTSKGYRRGLFEVNHTTGLWIDVTEDSNLTVAGVVPAQTTIHLYEGWNLVSFPSFNSSYTVYDLKMDTGAVRVEGCDPSPPYHLGVLEDAEVLLAGEAYWVRVAADNTWTVDIV
ncbi:MAG: hypothetical protein LN417_02080 [Candidatus Thermoplasmatota archaeon]|nr:hypothetical protein [Candidatus Thermoplasmatota archaeon]